MATYTELKSLDPDPVLLGRVEVAIWIAIHTIATEAAATANHAERVAWAREAIANPIGAAQSALRIALAANAGLTILQIQGAADAALQTAVNASIHVLAGIT